MKIKSVSVIYFVKFIANATIFDLNIQLFFQLQKAKMTLIQDLSPDNEFIFDE